MSLRIPTAPRGNFDCPVEYNAWGGVSKYARACHGGRLFSQRLLV